MKINLSGLSAEILQTESIDYTDTKDVKTLLNILRSKSDILDSAKLYVTVNEELVDENQSFNDNDKVLVFNPFAGG